MSKEALTPDERRSLDAFLQERGFANFDDFVRNHIPCPKAPVSRKKRRKARAKLAKTKVKRAGYSLEL